MDSDAGELARLVLSFGAGLCAGAAYFDHGGNMAVSLGLGMVVASCGGFLCTWALNFLARGA